MNIRSKFIVIVSICAVLLVLGLSGCTSPTPTAAPSATPGQGGYTVSPGPGGNTTAGVTFTDTNGKTVTLPKVAERIVVLNSDAAEILIAIGAKDKIVGVSKTVPTNPTVGSYFTNVTGVGEWNQPNPESIAQLKPDVIIGYASSPLKNMDQITATNATIVQLDCGNLKTIVSDITAMGIITGKTAEAKAYADYIQSAMDTVTSRIANITEAQKPTVYWEYNSAWSTAGNTSGGDTIINMAGAVNVAGSLGNKTSQQPKVSNEFVLTQNPKIIIKYSGFSVTNTTLQGFSTLRNETMAREGIAGVDAVKNNKFYVMSSTIAYGPKAFIGLLYTAKVSHPNRFSDVNPQAKLDEYAAKFVPGANKTIVFYPVSA